MAGPIQKAMSDVINTGAVVTGVTKKLKDDERQAQEKLSLKAKAEEENKQIIKTEAEEASLEADLINMGADPESARAFMDAKKLGLDTKGFGMIRKKGKFIGSYSTLAEKLSKDALTDSLSSRVMNEKGFADRIYALSGNRKGRVEALVKATKGGEKDGKK